MSAVTVADWAVWSLQVVTGALLGVGAGWFLADRLRGVVRRRQAARRAARAPDAQPWDALTAEETARWLFVGPARIVRYRNGEALGVVLRNQVDLLTCLDLTTDDPGAWLEVHAPGAVVRRPATPVGLQEAVRYAAWRNRGHAAQDRRLATGDDLAAGEAVWAEVSGRVRKARQSDRP